MVKVLKAGKAPDKWFTAECDHCKTVVLFLAADAQPEQLISWSDKPRFWYRIDCPTCRLKLQGTPVTKKQAKELEATAQP